MSKLRQTPKYEIDFLSHPGMVVVVALLSEDSKIGLAKMVTKAEFSDNPLRVLNNLHEEAEATIKRLS